METQPAPFKMRRHFSRMALFNLQERKNLFVYERIVFLQTSTSTMLSSLKNLQRGLGEYVQFRKLFLLFCFEYFLSIIWLYFRDGFCLFSGKKLSFWRANKCFCNGQRFWTSNWFRTCSNILFYIYFQELKNCVKDVDSDLFRSRFGTTAFFVFDGSLSTLAVHEDLFYFW